MGYCSIDDVQKYAVMFSPTVQDQKFPQEAVEFAIDTATNETKTDLIPRYDLADINEADPPRTVRDLTALRAAKFLMTGFLGLASNNADHIKLLHKQEADFLSMIAKGILLKNDIPIKTKNGPYTKLVPITKALESVYVDRPRF